MSIQTKARKLAILAMHPEILLSKKKYLFVVSHMRSRSSVLCHILGNNPEICGYKEQHKSYNDSMSLINFQIELVKDLKCNVGNKYLLDKMLHNTSISNEILAKAQPKILFLLREPKSTIRSIINLGEKTGIDWYKDPVKAANYYCKRLNQMQKLAQRLDRNYLFIDSDELIDNSQKTLYKIDNWLNLKEPLKSNYSTFKDTGVMGFGDPLENIKSGVLKPTVNYSKIRVPADLLIRAEESYNKCRNSFLGH